MVDAGDEASFWFSLRCVGPVGPNLASGEHAAVDKAPDAFRTISEVADELDMPQHVLRFWESRFPQIKPMKRAGGRRYYRPDDVDSAARHPASALRGGLHHPRRAAHPARAGAEVRAGGVAARRGSARDQRPARRRQTDAEQLAPDEAARTLFGLLQGAVGAGTPTAKPRHAERRLEAVVAPSRSSRANKFGGLQSALHELRECRRADRSRAKTKRPSRERRRR